MSRPARSSRPKTSVTTTPVSTPPKPGHSFEFYLVAAAMTTIGLLFASMVALCLAAFWFGWQQWHTFSQAASVSWPELRSQIEIGLQQQPLADQGHKNVLLLGVDSLAGRGDVPPLTDTMMLLSLDLQTATVSAVSLPRDIWNDQYQTKINALYAYGQARQPDNPAAFPAGIINQMTGVPIHHTVVVSLDQVAQVIDLLGGIPVTVETGFVDPQFPRPGVDVTVERDPAKLYQTVTFVPGPQTMSGERALQFIRSRHSEGSEGDDIARARRQQQVITALIQTAQEPTTWLDARRLGELYSLYRRSWSASLPLSEIIATAQAMKSASGPLTLKSTALPIFPDDPQGVLVHPPVSPQFQNQWVYSIREPLRFQAEIRSFLNQPATDSSTIRYE